jgi:hypothetical protein
MVSGSDSVLRYEISKEGTSERHAIESHVCRASTAPHGVNRCSSTPQTRTAGPNNAHRTVRSGKDAECLRLLKVISC